MVTFVVEDGFSLIRGRTISGRGAGRIKWWQWESVIVEVGGPDKIAQKRSVGNLQGGISVQHFGYCFTTRHKIRLDDIQTFGDTNLVTTQIQSFEGTIKSESQA